MTYAFTMDVPINEETYKRIAAELGPEPPQGMICHMVVAREGGLRYIDIWESHADWDRFQEERLHPVVDKVLAEAGFTTRPPEPEHELFDVRHLWSGQPVAVR